MQLAELPRRPNRMTGNRMDRKVAHWLRLADERGVQWVVRSLLQVIEAMGEPEDTTNG